MRLNKFVSIATELDQVRPELWAEYEAIHGAEQTGETPHQHH